MICLAFKPLLRGSLQGFADFQLDSGLILLGCSFHRLEGKAWVNPPGRPQLDPEKKLIFDNGKIAYAPVIEFVDKRLRYRWSAEAVAAIEEFQSKEPDGSGSMTGGSAPRGPSQGARRES